VELTASHAGLAVPDLDVLLARGLAFARLGRPDRAGATFDAARALDPGNPKVEVYEGTLHLMGGQRAAARAAYLRAVALNPATAAAHSALGAMAAEDGEAATALEHWRRALALDPREHAKLLAIGRGLWQAGRVAEARPLLELFLASAPGEASSAEVARVRALLAGG
jgi:tetratricopeptide (TPR) repeat protein